MKNVEIPHGIGDDPLNDKELEDKFRSMADKYFPEKQIKGIIDNVWNVDKLDNLNGLTSLMIIPSKYISEANIFLI